ESQPVIVDAATRSLGGSAARSTPRAKHAVRRCGGRCRGARRIQAQSWPGVEVDSQVTVGGAEVWKPQPSWSPQVSSQACSAVMQSGVEQPRMYMHWSGASHSLVAVGAQIGCSEHVTPGGAPPSPSPPDEALQAATPRIEPKRGRRTRALHGLRSLQRLCTPCDFGLVWIIAGAYLPTLW